MKFRSLLSVFVLVAVALPTIAVAQATAVAKFRYQLPAGDWREVYFKISQDTPAAAQAEVLKACNSARRIVLAGSVFEIRNRCQVSTPADFEIAQGIADKTIQMAAEEELKATAGFKGR